MRLLNVQLWPAELGVLKGPESEHWLLAGWKLKENISFKDGIIKLWIILGRAEIIMVIVKNYIGNSSP